MRYEDGWSYDGEYQQYMVAPVEALAAIPDGVSDVEAAPLLCAGITTYNALRHSGAVPGDLVAVQGSGGAIQLPVERPALNGRCVVALRFPLLKPTGFRFLFQGNLSEGSILFVEFPLFYHLHQPQAILFSS